LPTVRLLKDEVESTNTAEAGSESNVGHRQLGFVDQLLGEKEAPGLCDGDRRCTEVLAEETREMPRTDIKSCGKLVNAALVEKAGIDQGQCPRHRVRCAEPSRRARGSLGTAAKTRPKTGLRSRCGAGKVADVLGLRGRCRADWPAVDAGCRHANEEAPVEASIT
jgi:hypothetical protein